MDKLTAHACSLPLIHHLVTCPPEPQIERLKPLEARQQTAPDGQVLPAWLTWSPVCPLMKCS
jgi:hypothetical protein